MGTLLGDKKPSYKMAEKWLRRELLYLNPELYLIVGGVSANFFFPNRKLTNLVFADIKVNGKPAFVLPHPSPINIKWLKDNPDFEKRQIKFIRNKIYGVLGL